MRLFDVQALAIECYPSLAPVVRECATIREVQSAIRGYKVGGNDARPTAGVDAGVSCSANLTGHGLYAVDLVGFGQNKIGTIKLVRELTHLALKEAKDAVESARSGGPFRVISHVTADRAKSVGGLFTTIGADWALSLAD
jgi:ribosomal protein L7/L12